MTKTSNDVASRALSRMGVLAVGEVPTAEDKEQALIAMQGALDELVSQHGIAPWSLEAVPDVVFLAFADLTASEMAGVYPGVPAPNRSGAIGRIRAALLPDNREDIRDLDEDGTVDKQEVDAGQRAQFF